MSIDSLMTFHFLQKDDLKALLKDLGKELDKKPEVVTMFIYKLTVLNTIQDEIIEKLLAEKKRMQPDKEP